MSVQFGEHHRVGRRNAGRMPRVEKTSEDGERSLGSRLRIRSEFFAPVAFQFGDQSAGGLGVPHQSIVLLASQLRFVGSPVLQRVERQMVHSRQYFCLELRIQSGIDGQERARFRISP
jgi:hypothetical protein